ncbi:MAG: hypothetical protein WCJ25_03270 [Candidatus Moraniibacteriota bacterium]
MKKHYWFRPARFWKWFAFYHPTSKEGWIATGILLFLGFGAFLSVNASSHSVSDMLLAFAPWFIAIASVFDLLCFRFGEYPGWWRRESKRKQAWKKV